MRELSSSVPSRKGSGHSIKNMVYIDTGQLSRTRRLLTIALQMPQIVALCKKLYNKQIIEALERYFRRWVQDTKTGHGEKARKHLRMIEASLDIHRMARGFLGRRKVGRIRDQIEEVRKQKELEELVRAQTELKRKLHQERYAVQLAEQLKRKQQKSAIAIQRVFRGYLHRGEVILEQRKKLLQQLRMWARGLTNNLYSNRDLQSMELQAMIHTAIHFTTLPSKPIRNLPTLAQIQKYRAGIVAIKWKIANIYSFKKAEMRKRKKEMFCMRYEEILSKAHLRSLKLLNEKLAAKQLDEQLLLQRQLFETELREAQLTQQYLNDLQNHKQVEQREAHEVQWRLNEFYRKEKEAIEIAMERLQNRELELMKYEDLLSKQYQEEYCHMVVHKSELSRDTKNLLIQLYQKFHKDTILSMKVYSTAYIPSLYTITPGYHSHSKDQNQNKSYEQLKLGERLRWKYNIPYSMSLQYMITQLQLQLIIWLEGWKLFLSTLPLKASYQKQMIDNFQQEYIQNELFLQDYLLYLLQQCFYSYQLVYKRLHKWSLTSTKLYALTLTMKNTLPRIPSQSTASRRETNMALRMQLASQLINYSDLFHVGEDFFLQFSMKNGILRAVHGDKEAVYDGDDGTVAAAEEEEDNDEEWSSYGDLWKEYCHVEKVLDALEMKTMTVTIKDYMELNIQLNESIMDANNNNVKPSLYQDKSFRSKRTNSFTAGAANTLSHSLSGKSIITTPTSPATPKKSNSPNTNNENSGKFSPSKTPSNKFKKDDNNNLSKKDLFKKMSSNSPSKASINLSTFTRPPALTTIPFHTAPQYTLPISYRLIYPMERLIQLYYLIQYAYLVKQREIHYQILFQSITLFATLHRELLILRQQIKISKSLRYERQQLLFKAAEYEELLLKLRNRMIESGLWLYEHSFYEIKLFLLLFYGKESLVYEDMPWLKPEEPPLSSTLNGTTSGKHRPLSRGNSQKAAQPSNNNTNNNSKNMAGIGKITIIQPKKLFVYSFKSMRKAYLLRSRSTHKNLFMKKNSSNSLNRNNSYKQDDTKKKMVTSLSTNSIQSSSSFRGGMMTTTTSKHKSKTVSIKSSATKSPPKKSRTQLSTALVTKSSTVAVTSLRQLEELTHRLEHQPVGYKRKKKIQSDQLKDRQEGNDGNDGNGELLVVKSMSDVDETSSVSSVGSNRSDQSYSSTGSGKTSFSNRRNTTMFSNSNRNMNMNVNTDYPYSSSNVVGGSTVDIPFSPNRSRNKYVQEYVTNQIPLISHDLKPLRSSKNTSTNSPMASSSSRYASSSPSHRNNNTTAKEGNSEFNYGQINEKFRTFDHLCDECDSYWYDLQIDLFHTITPLDMLRLNTPPNPSYAHDGTPHFIKPTLKPSNRKFYFEVDEGNSSDDSNNSSQSAHSTQSVQSLRHHGGGHGRLKDAHGTISHHNHHNTRRHDHPKFKKPMKSSEKKKERKFFNIPGGNVFLEEDLHHYDFYHWCQLLISWIQTILQWKLPLEKQWKDQHIHDCFVILQRFQYLSDYSTDIEDANLLDVITRHGVIDKSSDEKILSPSKSTKSMKRKDSFIVNQTEDPDTVQQWKDELKKKRVQKNSKTYDMNGNNGNEVINRKMMILLQSARIEDMFELNLYKADAYLSTIYQGKEYKLTLDADTLDEYLGKHPMSLFIRMLMLHDVQYFQSSKVIPTFSWSSTSSMIELVQLHDNQLFNTLPIQSIPHSSKSNAMKDAAKKGLSGSLRSLELFNVLSKEVYELEQSIQTLFAQRLITFHVFHPLLSVVNTGLYFTPSVLPAPWYDQDKRVSALHMQNISTDEHWFFQFPAYMQPIIRYGTASPPETFLRRILREHRQQEAQEEQEEGMVIGKYTRIHRLDQRIDILVKQFILQLQKRQAVTKFLMLYFEKQRNYEMDRMKMAIEDERSNIYRYCYNMQLLQTAQNSCCFQSFGLCCLPKYATIHLETSSIQEQQYKQAIKRKKQLQIRLHNFRTHPIQYTDQLFTKLWRTIVYNNYQKTKEYVRLCQEHHMEMIENADFQTLYESLESIEVIMAMKQYVREVSWVTGERNVHMNGILASGGHHVNPRDFILPKIIEMATTYNRLMTCKFNNNKQTNIVQQEERLLNNCQEMFIAGGLKRMNCMMRIVECEEINARGTILFERLDIERISKVDEITNIFSKFISPKRMFPTGFSSNQLQSYWLHLVERILRTGFSFYPLCDNSSKQFAEIVTYRQHWFEKKVLLHLTQERANYELLSTTQLLLALPSILLQSRYQLSDIPLKRLIIVQAHIRGFLIRHRKNLLNPTLD